MDFDTKLKEILKPFPAEDYSREDCNSDDCPAYLEFVEKQVTDLTELTKQAWEQRTKALDINDFVTKQRDELAEQLEDEKRDVNLMLQTIRDGEEFLRRIRGQISVFYNLKRGLETTNPSKWSLTGISIEHDGSADIDAIERIVRQALIALRDLK
jgi:hypothetical protein